MIDKARIERLIDEIAGFETAETFSDYLAVSERLADIMGTVEFRTLLTDYLAMREIVEALAASDPIILDNGRFTCCHCRAQTVARYDVNGHKSTCRWRAARALIGPASKREEASE